jgi:hypothetical protein
MQLNDIQQNEILQNCVDVEWQIGIQQNDMQQKVKQNDTSSFCWIFVRMTRNWFKWQIKVETN